MMGCKIYYFSGSGNSLHVGRELQKRLAGTMLVPMIGLMDQASIVPEVELVGFVFPQHASQMPVIVAEFLSKMDLRNAGYVFAIVTRGGTPSHVFPELKNILRKSDKKLDAGFVVTMPGSSESLMQNYSDKINEQRINRLESEMLDRLETIQKIINNREPHGDEDLRGKEMPALYALFEPIFLNMGRRAERAFEFYSDSKCTGCRICEKVCLGNKIRMVNEKPDWQEAVSCVGCFACLNYCPEQSIQVKSTWFLKSYTPQNGRYHHAQITAGDIAAQKR